MLLPPVLSKDQLGKLPKIIDKNGTWVLSVWSHANTNSKGNSHSEVDEAVNIFLKRVSDLSQSIHLLKKNAGNCNPVVEKFVRNGSCFSCINTTCYLK